MNNMYYISFADGDLPKGEQFLGVVIVDSDDFLTAVRITHDLGINPGGEAMGIPFNDNGRLDKWKNKLMSKKDLRELDKELLK